MFFSCHNKSNSFKKIFLPYPLLEKFFFDPPTPLSKKGYVHPSFFGPSYNVAHLRAHTGRSEIGRQNTETIKTPGPETGRQSTENHKDTQKFNVKTQKS